MDTKKVLTLMFVFGLLVFMVAGCGNRVPLGSNQVGYVKVIDGLPREGRLQAFDDKLAAISDEASAKEAVLAFADYVDSRMKKDKVSAAGAGLNISESLIDKIAKIEAAERAGGVAAMGINTANITPDKMADTINGLVDDSEGEKISGGRIKSIQKEVRNELPHIAKDETEAMTPLESLVVGYTMYSDDNGGAGPGTVDLRVPDGKVSEFAEQIIN